VKVTYRCSKCNDIFSLEVIKPKMEEICKCGGLAVKILKNISFDKESDNVSSAIELMKYAKNPSGKQKTII
jgi:DNA-directed RNA polymerase subunit RPC12/RpoP